MQLRVVTYERSIFYPDSESRCWFIDDAQANWHVDIGIGYHCTGYTESKYPVSGSGVQLTTLSTGKPGYGRGMCHNYELQDDKHKGERELHDDEGLAEV